MLERCKNNLVKLSVLTALIIVAQPAWGRDGSRGRETRDGDDGTRMQSAPSERHSSDVTERGFSNRPMISESRYSSWRENRESSDRSFNRDFNFRERGTRFERDNSATKENRIARNERFNESSGTQTEHHIWNRTRDENQTAANNERFNNSISVQPEHRMWSRTGHENRTTIDRDSGGRWMADSRREHIGLRAVDSLRSDKAAFDRHFGDRDRFISTTRGDFAFFDRNHHFLNHRIVRPDFFFLGDFRFGHRHIFRPIFPFFHQRFLFVNPCGFWPYDYDYLRYYWYGCYPYYWYGYNPVPYEYGGDTNNYYTYNYYGDNSSGQASSSGYGNQPVDQSALKQVQEQAKPPASQTPADTYFDEGVKAFGNGDYSTATEKFAGAKGLSPNDKILPFAYSQSLLAAGNYTEAAASLREALAKVNPEAEGVFYPRGLYSDDDVLLKQIDALNEAAQKSQDSNLQLLLGYQQLGIGELDNAEAPLKQASTDKVNGPSAESLLQLLDKLQAAKPESAKD